MKRIIALVACVVGLAFAAPAFAYSHTASTDNAAQATLLDAQANVGSVHCWPLSTYNMKCTFNYTGVAKWEDVNYRGIDCSLGASSWSFEWQVGTNHSATNTSVNGQLDTTNCPDNVEGHYNFGDWQPYNWSN